MENQAQHSHKFSIYLSLEYLNIVNSASNAKTNLFCLIFRDYVTSKSRVTMAGSVSKKLELPKSVLDMKFMKKTKERLLKEQANIQDHGSLYSEIITDEMRSATGNYISEQSFLFCEDLLEGRLSFKGMNPEIERLMELETPYEASDGEMKKDISDDILAKKMAAFNKIKRESSTPIKQPVVKKRK